MIVQNLNFDQTVALAKAKAEKMIENGLYSRFRLSDKERLDKALLGCIGELAFQQHLSNLGIPFELDHTDFQSHHTDEFDVKVNDAKIDIKVAKKTTAIRQLDLWLSTGTAPRNKRLRRCRVGRLQQKRSWLLWLDQRRANSKI